MTVAFPATPLLLARARICISAAHTREDMIKALEVIINGGCIFLLCSSPFAFSNLYIEIHTCLNLNFVVLLNTLKMHNVD